MLAERNLKVHRAYVASLHLDGNAGASLTFFRLDDELAALLDYRPLPFFTQL